MDQSIIITALIGGGLIGLAASLLMLFNGKIAGISGIFSGLLTPKQHDTGWRLAFVLGLITGGTLLYLLRPELFAFGLQRSWIAIAAGGLLVGFGARLGSGCTSGHGVCGVARLGPRSIVATLTFITSGALATLLVERLLGGVI